MTGDKADNITGIDRVGPKTAAALIQKFGNVESVMKCAESIEKPSVRQMIQDNQERLRDNYRLIKLENCVELPYGIEELAYEYNNITTNAVLEGIGLR